VPTAKNPSQLRLRVFAGPNGSGKSTIIKEVRETKSEGKPIDVGYYINADDITQALKNGKFTFGTYKLRLKNDDLETFAVNSGLLNADFTLARLQQTYRVKGNAILLATADSADKLGQIIARYLREEMLRLKRRFSFETVFSHPSNLDIMKRAAQEGYKVYLYFVTTDNPAINIYRVELRTRLGGHFVPAETVRSRYYRSLNLLHEAAEIAYQAYFFDNSKENEPFELVAHFKRQGNKKVWDPVDKKKISEWFKEYYTTKDGKRKK
jgi:predicted ABC-type ATPase